MERKAFKNIIILSIIPLLLLMLNMFFIQDQGKYFMSCFDPTYAYLFNGINLASGKIEIGHLDHPGTPLQVLYAIIIKISFLFKKESNLIESVLLNPESYLRIISYVIILINIITVFLIGFFTFRHTQNIHISLFLQFTPIVSLQSVYSISMIACESLLLPLSTLLVILSFNYTYSNRKLNPIFYLIGFSLISAALITIKISSAPLIILPLIIITGYKNKLKYCLLTLIFTFVLVLPIISKISYFFDFIFSMATNLEKFGKGSSGILDLNEYWQNLKHIFSIEIPFTFFYLATAVTILLLIIKTNLRIKTRSQTKKLLVGIFLATTFQILMVAKQFSFHYLIPAYTLSILSFFTLLTIIKTSTDIFKSVNEKILSISLYALIPILFIRLAVYYNFYPNIQNPSLKTIEFLEKYEGKPIIILSERHKETALIEQALYFGVSYSGNLKDNYKTILKQSFNNSYFYSPEEELSGWNRNFMKEKFMAEYPEITIYIKYNDLTQKEAFINSFLNFQIPDSLYKISEIYENSRNHEIIYKLVCDTSSLKKLIQPKQTIFCDLELIQKDSVKFTDASGQYLFDKLYLLDNSKTYSGKNSIKLDISNPYGLDTKIQAKAGYYFEIIAWRYSKQNKGLIACTSYGESHLFKIGASVINQTSNGWEQVELSFYIPNTFVEEQINLFFWNNGKEEVYFDDIEIKIFHK